MQPIAENPPHVSSLASAALLLAAKKEASRLGLPFASADTILAATGAGRSRAYDIAQQMPAAVEALVRPPGRPSSTKPEPVASAPSAVVFLAVISFLIAHPGCVTTRGRRKRYSDGYRRFVLQLAQAHADLPPSALSEASCVPLPTLREWLAGDAPTFKDSSAPTDVEPDADQDRIATVIHAWQTWTGGFVPFCDHVRQHLRIPWGRTLIGSILQQAGVRLIKRRNSRAQHDGTLKGAFQTFFAGAQWQGDGSSVSIELNGKRYLFNVELMVDTGTDAAVGLSIRDTEDATAVTEAFKDGEQTTGTQPIALELDNKASNHCETVTQTLGTTLLLRATPATPQSNAFVEGAFGLFKQTMPPLKIHANNDKDLAKKILEFVVVTWARTLNRKSMPQAGGKSRHDLYCNEKPTEEQINQAREQLRQRARKQEKAQTLKKARQDPVLQAAVDANWNRLGLDDPDGLVRKEIARFTLNSFLAAVAVCCGKKANGTWPPDAGARYFLGIVRNIAQTDEGLAITDALIEARITAQDAMLEHLVAQWRHLRTSTSDPNDIIRVCIDRAMEASRMLDRLFWLAKAADVIRSKPKDEHNDTIRSASRRIFANFSQPYGERQHAMRFLAQKALPIT